MFLKKFVSVISALTIAVSTFAGLTLTASAAGAVEQYIAEYYIIGEDEPVYRESDLSKEECISRAQTNYVVTADDENKYIVKSFTYDTDYSIVEGNIQVTYTYKMTVSLAQNYIVTIAAKTGSNTILGSIGSVNVSEADKSYEYNYPQYFVSNNKLYSVNDNDNSAYKKTVNGTVSENKTVYVDYAAVSGYENATAITLLEPDGETVDGASKGGASKEVTYDLNGQGDYTVVARYKGIVTAKCGSESVAGFEENNNEWKEVTATFSNKSTESTSFTMTADGESYIDYVVLIRTGDAQSTLTYNNTGDGTGTVKIDGDDVPEGGFSATVGTRHTIVITADSNSYIKAVSIDGIDGVDWGTNEITRTATITMPSTDAKLNVEFGKLYNITISNTVGGVVTSSMQTAKEGQEIKVVAAADSGYVFGDMTYTYGEHVEKIHGNTFTMPAADVTINVTFNKLRTVSLARAVIKESGSENMGNPGTISSEEALTVSEPDATVSIEAETARGYKFVKFIYVPTEDSIDTLSYYTQEEFNSKYGEANHFEATASDPEKGMYGTVSGTLAVPDHNVTVIAVFEELAPITISEAEVTGGRLTPTVVEVYPGDTFGVNVTANEGYYMPESITVQYNSNPLTEINGEYTVPYPGTEDEYPGTITLSADFEKIPYNEVKTVVSNTSTPDYGELGDACGTITVSGTGVDNKAYKDAIITVSAVPADGYKVVGIKVTKTDGDEEITPSSTGVDSVTFTMPDCPVTVTAEFVWIDRLPYDVVINAETAKEFTADVEEGAVPASMWIDELKGLGLAYKPYVSVTVNHNNSESTKTAICNTTIAGDSSIAIAVVVDKAIKDVKSVKLSGLSENTEQTANDTFEEYDSNDGEV